MTVRWGNSLEAMADNLFAELSASMSESPSEVFQQRDCIVVPNRIQEAWLQQRFLFDAPRGATPHVLANVDFALLNVFAQEWLQRMDQPAESPARFDPEKHPFSVKSMRWRIYNVLYNGDLADTFERLDRYIRHDGNKDARKCFKLAGRIAKVFDEYQTYRPEMMVDWTKGGSTGTDQTTEWEPVLWRLLVKGQEQSTHLSAFLRMQKQLKQCKIAEVYRRIFVFAPSMLPPTHLYFFRALASVIPLEFYIFNPSDTDWFERERLPHVVSGNAPLDRPVDNGELLSAQNPLLGAYGRGSRDLIAAALDLTGGQIEDSFKENDGPTVLAALQRAIRRCEGVAPRAPMNEDDSIQLHLCHGKMREIEILRDQLLACFEELKELQPRHIQVQVPDLNEYAPYIETVFSSENPNGKKTIPFTIADRVAAGESRIAEAFRQLLELADSRFAAVDVLDLLRCETLALSFGLTPKDVDNVALWLNKAGVRWGKNASHRKQVSGADFSEETSWQYSMDRLFLGYAMGQETQTNTLTDVIPSDCVEGDGAIQLGNLANFYHALVEFAEFCRHNHSPATWAERLERLLDDFFISDNNTYRDVAILKGTVRLLRTTEEAAQFDGKVPVAIIRDFLAGRLGEATGGGDINRNTVVFSSLRPGSSTPRRVQCLLGMGDSLFPRTENRPAYDLLRSARKMGDRSTTIEDRLAFLEALTSARERLLIFYPAYSEEDNSPLHKSVVVNELVEYLRQRFGGTPDDAPVKKMSHRLHPWHPAYFTQGSKLSSFSETNCSVAKALSDLPHPPPASHLPPPPTSAPPPIRVDLSELVEFFEHPGRYYFRHILGAEPTPRGDELTGDAEPFDLDALQRWKAREELIRSFVEGKDDAHREALLNRLTADGVLPLGWDKEKREAFIVDIRDLLQHKLEGGTVLEALQELQNTPAEQWSTTLTLDERNINLFADIRLPQSTRIVDFFHTENPKVIFRSWLPYLFLAATGRQVTSIIVQSGKEKLIAQTFKVLSAADAKKSLESYLRLFLSENRPLPYTPKTAWAYIKKLKGNDKPDPIKAQQDARNAWSSGYSQSHYDAEDSYFVALFAGASPLDDWDLFAKTADQIFGPVMEHLVKVPIHA